MWLALDELLHPFISLALNNCSERTWNGKANRSGPSIPPRARTEIERKERIVWIRVTGSGGAFFFWVVLGTGRLTIARAMN